MSDLTSNPTYISAQTEGDTGYDYNDAYDEEYEDESGRKSLQLTAEQPVAIHFLCMFFRSYTSQPR